MTNNIFRFGVVLVIVTGCILFIQWKGITTFKIVKGKDMEQTIVIRHVNNQFLIKQTIRNIPEGTYTIGAPVKIKNMICKIGESERCQWSDDKDNRLKIQESTITFTYALQSVQDTDDYFLLENWAVTITDNPISFTRVQLTEKEWRTGNWAAGAELSGKEEMEALDYYVFESTSGTPPLYWQKNKLIKHGIAPNFTLYTDKNIRLNLSAINRLSMDEKTYAIVSNNIKKASEKESLLFVPGHVKPTEKYLVQLLLKRKALIEKEDEWMIDLIAAIITEQPAGNKKVNKMQQSLTENLTKKQLERWIDSILSAKTTITSDMLDEFVEKAAGFKTDFFQKNTGQKRALQPFYILDSRPVFVEGVIEKDITILHENDRTYISFFPLIKKIGYHVVESEGDEAVIKKGANTYHFKFTKKLFTLNDTQYGFPETPFFLDQEDTYIDAAWFSELFQYEVSENEDKDKIFIQ